MIENTNFGLLNNSRVFKSVAIFALGISLCGSLPAGLFSRHDATVHPIDPGIPANSPLFVQWAATVVNYAPAPGVDAAWSNPNNALGPYNTSLVSLGDLSAQQIADGVAPGSITLGFATPFGNTSGFDFAVFENGFGFGGGLFAELAYVEVSSNGTDFARFPSISTNTAPLAGGGAFSGWDMTNVHNLAGKHQGGLGTPFNLNDLRNDPLVLGGQVNLNAISYVRIVDIPGNGHFLDALGNPILDAWQTTGSGGFDLRAIGVIPEPAHTAPLFALAMLGVVFLRRLRNAPRPH